MDNIKNGLELHSLKKNMEFYDDIGRRFISNNTKENLVIGFGHNIRAVETIRILPEEVEDPKLKELINEEMTDE